MVGALESGCRGAGLLGARLSNANQAECDEVARELNMRLRKRLGLKFPHWAYHHA